MGSPLGRPCPLRSGYAVSFQARLSADVRQNAAMKANPVATLQYRMIVLRSARINATATPLTARPLAVEIAQIGRGLTLRGGHEFSVGVQIVEFLADQHVC